MPSYRSTTVYAAAQLRRDDWVTRHYLLARLRATRPALYRQIMAVMTPDEALFGTDYMAALPEHTIIVMKDRSPAKHMVQTKITKYFRRVSAR